MPRNGDKTGSTAAVGFDYCNQLFAIEKELKELTPEERKKQRQERSKAVLEAYWSWLEKVNPFKGSKLGEAVTYALNQKDALETFLKDGRIELIEQPRGEFYQTFCCGEKIVAVCRYQKGSHIQCHRLQYCRNCQGQQS